MPRVCEYQTQVVPSFGRDLIRMEDMNAVLSAHGKQGWEFAWLETGVNVKGQPDGHLLIFKRPAEVASTDA